MAIVDKLEQQALRGTAPRIRGSWRPVVMTLDRAGLDRLTVGVVFQSDDSEARAVRLLQNLSGIRCMYGPDGASNAWFAIQQAQAAIEEGVELPLGWSISMGPEAYAQGHSAEAIVSELFGRLVPLARHELAEEDRVDSDDHQLSTRQLRKNVRSLIRQRYKAKAMPEFWKDKPIVIDAPDGRRLSLDLQIWQRSTMFPDAMAAITSAWYTSKFYRDSYLNGSYRSLSEARQLSPDARGALYLLRPMNDDRFSEAQLTEIDEEIDEISWALKKNDIETNVFDNEVSLAEGVLAFA